MYFLLSESHLGLWELGASSSATGCILETMFERPGSKKLIYLWNM
jgi:hypothetical protein